MITKKAEYAILILTELAAHPPGYRITSREIASNRMLPRNLVIQLLPLLNHAGWIVGSRGPKGGITLKVDPAALNLRDVIEYIDGPIGITRCLFSDSPCQDQKECSLRNIWAQAQNNMLSVLEGVTIKDLCQAAPTK